MESFDLQQFLSNLTSRPGIYQMLNSNKEIHYVGKAKNLKKRVSSYFQKQDHVPKTKVMVSQISEIQVVITGNENEALILENQLIKKFKPRYNIIFRDDKTYPYIFLSDEDYPRLSIHRGKQSKKGDYFGPFTGSSAARYSISLMQKLFAIRQCENSTFNYRSRPCLQYQIDRCSGSCVNKISKLDYHKDVDLVRLFYQGKNDSVVDALSERMQQASNQQAFEKAAHFRDQIVQLRRVLEKQSVNNLKNGKMNSIDIIAADSSEKTAVVFVLHVRNGLVQGSRQLFPKMPTHTSNSELITSFIGHFYPTKSGDIPNEIITSEAIENEEFTIELLQELAGRKVKTSHHVKTSKASWLKMAKNNASQLLTARLQ
ncbi:MAG: excinuclease ABC subunit UvrC, partial [Kangiellaceae bacterium]|nr:excinuclease ABC subunit UvrC [Kangiellaceae bacterium]